MATAIINGRRVDLPSNTSAELIREKGSIRKGRTLIRRTREGNHVVPSGASVAVAEGDVFIDAPSRTKG
jgi:hypothetical protein